MTVKNKFDFGVACINKDWGIGKDGNLIAMKKQDMDFFKSITKNSLLIMGKNTFLSIPSLKPFIERGNICVVISRGESPLKGECFTSMSIEELLNEEIFYSKLGEEARGMEKVIIGGSFLYNHPEIEIENFYITKLLEEKYNKKNSADTFIDRGRDIFKRKSIRLYKDKELEIALYSLRQPLNI